MDKRWGYIGMVDRLSNGDPTKHNELYKMNYKYLLTQLLYWKEKDEYIEKINDMNKAKSKINYH